VRDRRSTASTDLLLITNRKLYTVYRFAPKSMTLDDLEHQNRGFYVFFCNFELRHTFWERILSKSLQMDQYNLHMKFLTLNIDLNGPSLDLIGSKWPAHKGIKYESPPKTFYFTTVGCVRPVTPSGECKLKSCMVIGTTVHGNPVVMGTTNNILLW